MNRTQLQSDSDSVATLHNVHLNGKSDPLSGTGLQPLYLPTLPMKPHRIGPLRRPLGLPVYPALQRGFRSRGILLYYRKSWIIRITVVTMCLTRYLQNVPLMLLEGN